MSQSKEIIAKLESLRNQKNIEGMSRFGINPDNAYGINMPVLRKMAKDIGSNHALAQELWESGIHEARILASMIDEIGKVTGEQMDSWARDFDSWDVCDQTCMNLFSKTRFAHSKAVEWSRSEEEFVKRAGFALMACIAWTRADAKDEDFEKFFIEIKKASDDERNFVRKSVNWALRQIGKRNVALNGKAIRTAEQIQRMDSKAAKWIANDALRELTSTAVQKRLKSKR